MKTSWRATVRFYLDNPETSIGLWSNLIILGLILISSGIFVAETYPISARIEAILNTIDLIILLIFTLEYGLRFWSAESKIKWLFSLFALIDLLAILPLVLGFMDIRFIRIFRWFRILRIIRFWEIKPSVLKINAEDEIVFVRIFLTLFCLIFVYSGLIYQVEYRVDNEKIANFFDAFYFVVVTMTTVGYGDVTPLSQAGKAMTVIMIFTGVLFIPWQLSELIKQIVNSANTIAIKCSNCGLSRHDTDAFFCKQCGMNLKLSKE